LTEYNISMSFATDFFYRQKFSKLSLTRENIQAKTFEECEFADCSFIDCKFEKTRFLNCQFAESILSAVVPMNCRFNEVKFINCKVMGIDWTKTQFIRDLEFRGCRIDYSNFKLLKIPKLKLIDCEAKEADFTETDLSAGEFKNTDFEKAVFFKTNLTNADFRGAKNYFIDVKNNVLKKTHFSLPEALVLLQSLDIILD
jgi:fluoroquinolone resistance protein